MADTTWSAPRTARERAVRMLPFLGVTVLTFPLALIGHHPGQSFDLVIGAAAIFGGIALSIVVLPWWRFPDGSRLAVVVAFCTAVALLRQSGGGGSAGYASMLILPVVWQSLHGRRRDVILTMVCVLTTLAAPVALIGGPEYPTSEWRRVILSGMTLGLTGFVVNQLVGRIGRLVGQLEGQAHRDQLTGVLNRRAWDETLTRELARLGRTDHRAALAILDLDHFKWFNDEHGHLAGDRVLVDATRAWAAELRDGDVLARWGGEEFVVLLPGGSVDEAVEVLARLRAVTPAGQSFSAGLVAVDGTDARTLLRRADEALYAAKAAGRGRTHVAPTEPADRVTT